MIIVQKTSKDRKLLLHVRRRPWYWPFKVLNEYYIRDTDHSWWIKDEERGVRKLDPDSFRVICLNMELTSEHEDGLASSLKEFQAECERPGPEETFVCVFKW